ncbi:transporter [Klebsiella pneumoniae subsp. pneumoniae]|nr:transporter [Klebsiella pneumoniae subsp. pneumoniae]
MTPKVGDGAAFALTLFSCAFVGARLLFPNAINRLGGLNVAMLCFSVEAIGLLLVRLCRYADDGENRYFPYRGWLFAGLSGAGRGGGESGAAAQSGVGAGDYTVFMDLSLGVSGPLAGLLMAWTGISMIYLAAAGLVMAALLLGWRLKKRPPVSEPEASAPGQ